MDCGWSTNTILEEKRVWETFQQVSVSMDVTLSDNSALEWLWWYHLHFTMSPTQEGIGVIYGFILYMEYVSNLPRVRGHYALIMSCVRVLSDEAKPSPITPSHRTLSEHNVRPRVVNSFSTTFFRIHERKHIVVTCKDLKLQSLLPIKLPP